MGKSTIREQLDPILNWYFHTIYGVVEGPGILPWYCDVERIGHFALDPSRLLGRPTASSLFKLFITMTMFQAFRDVVITQRQRAMTWDQARDLTSLLRILNKIDGHRCRALSDAETFPLACDVYKSAGQVDCHRHPGQECPVKRASQLLRRMGDMGKLPVSAALLHRQEGLLALQLQRILESPDQPAQRANYLIGNLTKVFRVGTKLAMMWTSALSTPSLAPGLTPFFPAIQGDELVVIDTNVSQSISILTGTRTGLTYQAQAHWLQRQARKVDLQAFDSRVASYSPRMVQQALYWFRSKFNRLAIADPCRGKSSKCQTCCPRLCPFAKNEI